MNEWLSTADTWAQAWGPTLWRASWQGAIALGVAAAIARWCKFLSPRVICWVWRAACLKLLVALVWLNPVSLPLLPAPAVVAAAAQSPAPSISWNATAPAAPVATNSPVRSDAGSSPQVTLVGVLLMAWLIGVALRMAITARQAIAIRRLALTTRPMTSVVLKRLFREEVTLLGIRRAPRLRQSGLAEGPLLMGILRPTILLPEGIETDFDEAELRLMLAHELAHLKRRDLVWNWLPTLAGWLFFFHPFVWLMGRRWSEAQEAACDELVLQRRRVPAADYGRLLVKLASRWPQPAKITPLTAGVLGGYRELEQRILAMARVRPFSWSRMTMAIALLLLIATPGIVPWKLVAQEATLAPEKPPAVPQEKANATNEVKVTDGGTPSDEAAIFSLALDDAPPLEPKFSEAHQLAAAALTKLGIIITPYRPKGSAVLISAGWKGNRQDLDRLRDLDEVQMVIVDDCRKTSTEMLAALKNLPAPFGLQLIHVNDEQLAVFKDFERISFLMLTTNLATDEGMKSVGTLSNLTSIMLSGDPTEGALQSLLNDNSLAPLANCKKLERITLASSSRWTGSTLGQLADLPKLTQLYLTEVPLSDAGAAAIAELPHLTQLMAKASQITSTGYAALGKAKSLDRLSLYDAKNLDDAAAASLAELRQLRGLSLYQTRLTDAGLASIAGLKRLQALDIGQEKIGDAGLAHLAALVRLRRLSLQGDSQITDAGLEHLKSLVHLKDLNLSANQVTDAGLAALAGCAELQLLNLAGSQVTGSGLTSLKDSSKLKSLNFSDTQFENKALAALGQFPNLTILELNNTLVTDEGLKSLAELPGLAELSLKGDKITDAGLESLVNIKSLRTLRLSPGEISAEGQKKLRDKIAHVDLGGVYWTLTSSAIMVNEFVPYDDDPKVEP